MCLGLRSLARILRQACARIPFSLQGFLFDDIVRFLKLILFLWETSRRTWRCTRIFICWVFVLWMHEICCLKFVKLVRDRPSFVGEIASVNDLDFYGWNERLVSQIHCRHWIFLKMLFYIYLHLKVLFVQICHFFCFSLFLRTLLMLFNSLDIFMTLSAFLQMCFDGQWLVLALFFFCLISLPALIVFFVNSKNFVLFCLSCFYVVNLKISIHVILILDFLGVIFNFIAILIFMSQILSNH